MGTFEILHSDHGINKRQWIVIKRVLQHEARQGFFIMEIELDETLGSVPNALYGPASGDVDVPESEVTYVSRNGREWKDRMVDRPVRETQTVQCIGTRTSDAFTLFTVHGGPLAPQHPEDPSNKDPEGSRHWWSRHALSSQQGE